MMNTILKDFLDKGVVVYIDDISIYSRSWEQYEEQVSAILERIQQKELTGEPDKYNFSVTGVNFLGHVISTECVEMLHDKVGAIDEGADLRSLKDIQIFMELANVYREFIENFSIITRPITNILRGYAKYFKITNECRLVSLSLKRAFSSAPILCNCNPKLNSIIKTDASNIALGAILSQRH